MKVMNLLALFMKNQKNLLNKYGIDDLHKKKMIDIMNDQFKELVIEKKVYFSLFKPPGLLRLLTRRSFSSVNIFNL